MSNKNYSVLIDFKEVPFQYLSEIKSEFIRMKTYNDALAPDQSRSDGSC
jgi:hypothetical protein